LAKKSATTGEMSVATGQEGSSSRSRLAEADDQDDYPVRFL
jgi:hypothetical protein